jgi:hypothetical protein
MPSRVSPCTAAAPRPRPPLRFVEIGRPNDDGQVLRATPADLAYVVGLQKRNHEALGFIPRVALEQKIDLGRIWLATENGEPAGYLHHGSLAVPEVRIFQAAIPVRRPPAPHGAALVADLLARAAWRRGARRVAAVPRLPRRQRLLDGRRVPAARHRAGRARHAQRLGAGAAARRAARGRRRWLLPPPATLRPPRRAGAAVRVSLPAAPVPALRGR